MLNPKLKEIYTKEVIPTLEIISNFLEERNVVAYVYDKKTYKGITAPVAIVFDEPSLDTEVSILTEKSCRLYMDLLEPEDEEYFVTITVVGKKSIWENIVREKTSLWVK